MSKGLLTRTAHEDDGGCVVCREWVPGTDDVYVRIPFPCPTARLAAAACEHGNVGWCGSCEGLDKRGVLA